MFTFDVVIDIETYELSNNGRGSFALDPKTIGICKNSFYHCSRYIQNKKELNQLLYVFCCLFNYFSSFSNWAIVFKV